MIKAFSSSLTLIILAIAFNGILAGASLDQVIKQLPSRYEIGPMAFSAYSQAADLSNGVIWYGTIGIGSAIFTIASAIGIFSRQRNNQSYYYYYYVKPIYIAAILSVAHSVVTAIAAPTNFQQLEVSGDEQALTQVFNNFERLSLVRAILQVAAFGAILLGLCYYVLNHKISQTSLVLVHYEKSHCQVDGNQHPNSN
jgi:hypothetical protein